MNHRFSDIVVEPEIFEFVLNFLQSVSTFSRIAHCDRIINSVLQPELRSNSLKSDNLEPDINSVGDLVLVQGNWCWNSTGGNNST